MLGSFLVKNVLYHFRQKWRSDDRIMSRVEPNRQSRRRDPLRRAIVIIEEPAETLATANPTSGPPQSHTVNEIVPEALVIVLTVVVFDELMDGSS